MKRASMPDALSVALCAALGCRHDAGGDETAVLRKLGGNACSPRLIIVHLSPGLPRDVACRVATVARNYIGRGGASRLDVSPRDTAGLVKVGVAVEDIEYPDRPTDRYWEVDFALPNPHMSLAVRIDRRTGQFTAGFTEPIFQPR